MCGYLAPQNLWLIRVLLGICLAKGGNSKNHTPGAIGSGSFGLRGRFVGGSFGGSALLPSSSVKGHGGIISGSAELPERFATRQNVIVTDFVGRPGSLPSRGHGGYNGSLSTGVSVIPAVGGFVGSYTSRFLGLGSFRSQSGIDGSDISRNVGSYGGSLGSFGVIGFGATGGSVGSRGIAGNIDSLGSSGFGGSRVSVENIGSNIGSSSGFSSNDGSFGNSGNSLGGFSDFGNNIVSFGSGGASPDRSVPPSVEVVIASLVMVVLL
ncbi:keratin, type I cytoskeletal 9-like [Homarus americanus]|uniref:keratin, type I cytoskeletal 9-like n=1 Tax=Homarus americanus TaxID=6706 RepID=UPI001C43748B|nr:keratin, type I cytoskeletal 9-like [Homarus americanus]